MNFRFILTFFLVTFIMTGSVFAESRSCEYSGPRIVLKGEVGTETGRSVIPDIPIEAFVIENNMIYIQYSVALGTVEVSVAGQVQKTIEVTIVGQETSISIEGWASGIYKLEFKTPKGGYVYGEFVVE